MFKKVVAAFILSGILFCGSVSAYDYERTRGEDAISQSWLLFDEYTTAAAVEHFGGSSTPSGGSTSVSDGFINTEGIAGDKYLSINLTSVTGTGTFRIYTFFGTDSLDGTKTAVLYKSYDYTAATSSVTTIPVDCRGVALSTLNSNSGTHTFSAGLDYILSKSR